MYSGSNLKVLFKVYTEMHLIHTVSYYYSFHNCAATSQPTTLLLYSQREKLVAQYLWVHFRIIPVKLVKPAQWSWR